MIEWTKKNYIIIGIAISIIALAIAIITMFINFLAWRLPVTPSDTRSNISVKNDNDQFNQKNITVTPTILDNTNKKELTPAPKEPPNIEKLTPTPVESPMPQKSPTPNPTSTPVPSRLAGLWEFNFKITDLLYSNGVRKKSDDKVTANISLDESSGNITGTQLSLQGDLPPNSCQKAKISGLLDGNNVTFTITYECCQKSQVKFTGTVDKESRNITGNITPVSVPGGNNCQMPYAEISGTKKL